MILRRVNDGSTFFNNFVLILPSTKLNFNIVLVKVFPNIIL